MTIYSVFDEAFRPYGAVHGELDTGDLLERMGRVPMPAAGTAYEPSIGVLEGCSCRDFFEGSLFGGLPVQMGMCWGYNTKLNCLEYHRSSEFNLGTEDFILLFARQEEIRDFMLDTACVKAFRVPKGVLVEVYATTLHYAPCHTDANTGFRVLVALPKGTNTEKPVLPGTAREDGYLTARNKWLLAHPESSEAKNGALVGLKGENIDIGPFLK